MRPCIHTISSLSSPIMVMVSIVMNPAPRRAVPEPIYGNLLLEPRHVLLSRLSAARFVHKQPILHLSLPAALRRPLRSRRPLRLPPHLFLIPIIPFHRPPMSLIQKAIPLKGWYMLTNGFFRLPYLFPLCHRQIKCFSHACPSPLTPLPTRFCSSPVLSVAGCEISLSCVLYCHSLSILSPLLYRRNHISLDCFHQPGCSSRATSSKGRFPVSPHSKLR